MIREFIIANPKPSIIVLSFLVTLVMTLVTKKYTDQNRMKELKSIQKACQIKLKDAKGDMKKQQEIQKEMMDCSMELMKHSFKPILITFIPIIIFFSWIRGIFLETTLAGAWLWYYIGASIISSIFLRKVLDVA